MAEILETGYRDLRQYVFDNWRYVALENENGTEITRIAWNDHRLSITYTEGQPAIRLDLTVKGSDHDLSAHIPMLFGSVSIYKNFSGGLPLARDEFNPLIPVNNIHAEIRIDQYIEVPRITY